MCVTVFILEFDQYTARLIARHAISQSILILIIHREHMITGDTVTRKFSRNQNPREGNPADNTSEPASQCMDNSSYAKTDVLMIFAYKSKLTLHYFAGRYEGSRGSESFFFERFILF